MLSKNQKAYKSSQKNSRQMSAGELKVIALETIDDIQLRLEKIAETWKELLQKLANLDPVKLFLSDQEKYFELEAQKCTLEKQLTEMNERWAARLALLGKTDQVNVYHVWRDNMVEIVCSQKGKYAINFLAIEYLRKIVSDGRALSDLTRKTGQLNDIIETLNDIDNEVNQNMAKIARTLNISPARASEAYERNSIRRHKTIFDHKF